MHLQSLRGIRSGEEHSVQTGVPKWKEIPFTELGHQQEISNFRKARPVEPRLLQDPPLRTPGKEKLRTNLIGFQGSARLGEMCEKLLFWATYRTFHNEKRIIRLRQRFFGSSWRVVLCWHFQDCRDDLESTILIFLLFVFRDEEPKELRKPRKKALMPTSHCVCSR